MQDRDTLMAIAQIAATFIGFAGVVFAVERASAGGVSDRERNAIMNLLVPSIAVLFLAAGAFRAAIRGQLLEPIPVRFILLGGGSLAVLANVIIVLGFAPQLAVMAFITGLVWFLLVSAIQFVMLIVLHVRTG